MPKNTPERRIDARRNSSGYSVVYGGSAGSTVVDHGALAGLLDDDHPQYLTAGRGDTRYVPLARSVAAGAGLAGGGDLSANRTLSLASSVAGAGLAYSSGVLSLASSVAGDGLSYTGGVLAVGVGGLGLSVAAHAVNLTSSSNPGPAAAILASDAAGLLRLRNLEVALQGAATPAVSISGADNVTTGADIQFSSNGLIAAENSLYLAIDSSNLLTTAVLIIGNNSPTSGFSEIARFTEAKQLGIGKTPTVELDVNGAANASTSVTSPLVYAATKVQTPLLDTASGHLTLSPVADVLLNPGSNLVKLQSGKNLQSHNYASQTTGMRVTWDGQADFRYLFVDEMHAKLFVADLEQALAGGQIIAKSVTTLPTAWSATNRGGSGTITVRDLPSAPGMAVFQPGDVIGVRTYSRAGGGLTIGDVFVTVGTYTDNGDGTQTWTVTRFGTIAGGSGSVAGGTVIPKDTIVIDYGVSGGGYHEVSAIDGVYGANSPYSQVVTWSGTTPGATGSKAIRTRLGNLYGVFSSTGEYGLYAGDGGGDANQYLRISNQGVRLNNVPLQLWAGSPATQRVNLNATGTNVWFRDASGNAKLTFDGTDLTIAGTVTANAGAIGGWTIAATALSGANVRLVSGANARVEVGTYTDANTAGMVTGSASGHVILWAGSTLANRATAPFRVTLAGDLTAISATITGNITANTGYIGGASGWAIAAGQLTSTNIGLYSGANARLEVGASGINYAGIYNTSAGNDIAFWAGQTAANRTAAPFRVTAGGILTATSVSIATGKATLDSSGVTIAAPSGWDLDYGYKFTYGNQKAAGLTANYQSGNSATLTLWNNTTDDGGTAIYSGINSFTTIKNIASAGGYAQMTIGSYHVSGAKNATLILKTTSIAREATIGADWLKLDSNTVWHSGNDGSGSGLDADLLDNRDASYFATATHNHDSAYAALTGASFSGAVSFSSTTTFGTTLGITKNAGDTELGKYFDVGLWRDGYTSSAPSNPPKGYIRLFMRYKPGSSGGTPAQLIALFSGGTTIVLAEGVNT